MHVPVIKYKVHSCELCSYYLLYVVVFFSSFVCTFELKISADFRSEYVNNDYYRIYIFNDFHTVFKCHIVY